MRQRIGILFALGLLIISVATTGAQDLKVEADQYYLVLEVTKLSTFEKEIKVAADLGFRLMISCTSDDGARIQALMERVATPPDVFQYKMVATFSEKTGDKEMNAAAAEGFRVVPHTAMIKKGFTIFNINKVVIMEKTPKSPDLFEYRSFTAFRTATFHRELKAAISEGWKVVDTLYGSLLLERKKA